MKSKWRIVNLIERLVALLAMAFALLPTPTAAQQSPELPINRCVTAAVQTCQGVIEHLRSPQSRAEVKQACLAAPDDCSRAMLLVRQKDQFCLEQAQANCGKQFGAPTANAASSGEAKQK